MSLGALVTVCAWGADAPLSAFGEFSLIALGSIGLIVVVLSVWVPTVIEELPYDANVRYGDPRTPRVDFELPRWRPTEVDLAGSNLSTVRLSGPG